MSKNRKWVSAVAVFVFTLVVTFAHSLALQSFVSYINEEEIHTVSPIFEAVARDEVFYRCANNYGVGESKCSSHSVMIDALYLGIVSKILGVKPPVIDPEFVEPNLKWFLIIKRGVVVAALMAACFLILRLIFASESLAWLFVILYLFAPQLQTHGFEVKQDSEMGPGSSGHFLKLV